MAQIVPDELLRDILKYTLRPIPLQDYLEESETVRDEELGGPHKMPPTDVLLVCKRWLRVATPLFYEYVRISTAEQMRKLAAVLRANPDFGPMIRHLRISGGYGRDLDTVSKYTTNVKTLAVYGESKSKDSNVGILRALSRLNPSRLYLFKAPFHRTNKKIQAINNALYQAISSWSSLKYLYLIGCFSTTEELMTAIQDAPSLQVLSMNSGSLSLMFRWRQPPFSDVVAKISAIHCRAMEGTLDHHLSYQGVPATTKERIVYKPTQSVIDQDDETRIMEERVQTLAQLIASPLPSEWSGSLGELFDIFMEQEFEDDAHASW